jgi:hypothetical protein
LGKPNHGRNFFLPANLSAMIRRNLSVAGITLEIGFCAATVSGEHDAIQMNTTISSLLACLLVLAWSVAPACGADEPADAAIRHSYLVLGGKTAIIGEDDKAQWEYRGGSRDGFVLPNGNVLLAFADRVEEVAPAKERLNQTVFSYKRSPENGEISTAQRLYNGDTLVTELGPRPRLLEVNAQGKLVLEVPLQPETDNVHMQTRMARQLRNGNFLVPHLLAFAVKEYSPEGKVVRVLKTDLEELGGRPAENWPFTAIRLDDGNTLVSLTHGNKVVELNPRGEVVWNVGNEHVGGQFKDPCGAQRLANGNTVVGSHGASKGVSMIEVTRERKIVWTSQHPLAAGVHHFQILTTNGKPEPGMPLK